MSVVKRSPLAQALVGVIILTSIGGCNRSDTTDVVVDHHTFRVPEKYLLKGSIPWLPVSQSEGLNVVINPEARLQEQMIVGISSTQITCKPKTQPTSDMLSLACAKTGKNSGGQPHEAFNPEKVYPHRDDPTQWEYRQKVAGGNYETVASCYALSDGNTGLCRSISNYKDLVYSVGFREIDIQHLPEVWAKVYEMLSAWDTGLGEAKAR